MKNIKNNFKSFKIIKIISLIKRDYVLKKEIKNKKLPFTPKVLDSQESLKIILKDNLSVGRFGDGEIRWLLNIESPYKTFEKISPKLTKRLEEVLHSNISGFKVAIPPIFNDDGNRTLQNKVDYESLILEEGEDFLTHLNRDTTYLSTELSGGPYVELDFKKSKETYKLFKKIWENKNLLIVEGRSTKLGMTNDLLDNAKSIKRIECPSVNAFESYETIYGEVENNLSNIDLVLCLLGPTATVLAYDICKNFSVQALDLGHVGNNYDNFLKWGNQKSKYINSEVIPTRDLNEIEEKKFKKQVISNI